MPVTCGLENRAATLEATKYAVETVEVRPRWRAACNRNLRVVPFNREGDRRIAQNAEVIGIVRVFHMYSPSTTRYLPKACWKPAMKFILNRESRER